ncbi:MAG: class I SAM-dependent methyltransferase [Actinomycetia bacterium]|nr:class I SAM-dependent methyltransferase [Actinomycetes bacterium]
METTARRHRLPAWQTTGVDFSAVAIGKARVDAQAVPNAHFIEGDATRLTELGITRPVTLAIDMGGYHSLPHAAKPVYVAQLAALLEPGTPVLMWQGIGVGEGEIPDVFGGAFIVEESKPKDFAIRRKLFRRNVSGTWYRLRRR